MRIEAARWIAVLGLSASATACGFPKTGPAPASLTAADVASATSKWPDTNEAELTTGHDAFVAKCNGCHGYPDIQSVATDQWPAIMDKMAKKADLDPKGKQAVLRFVEASKH